MQKNESLEEMLIRTFLEQQDQMAKLVDRALEKIHAQEDSEAAINRLLTKNDQKALGLNE